jgi:DNA (cytosine-5)-methyltransferase 1
MKKPEYKIPSMRSIRGRKKNGLKAISTFSGCGGSCLGLRWAGFDVLWASEFIPAARETYQANFPGVPVDDRDIREVEPKEILKATGLKKGEVDLLEGSPPCASFSTSGLREEHWGDVTPYSDTKQRTDDLFFEFARILKGLKPRVFFAENVPALTQGKAIGYFKQILAALRATGYKVETRILDSQWLGVPQRRRRLFFVGVRNDLRKQPVFPEPLGYSYSIGDVLPYLIDVPWDPLRKLDRELEIDVSDEERHSMILPRESKAAEELARVRPGTSSNKYFNFHVAKVSKPCPTVVAEGGNSHTTAAVVSVCGSRKFSIAELRKLSGFPDDFILTGQFRKQWERLGRAVPPPVSRAIAVTIAKEILQRRP